jgi:EmrB/QacA subfamily drug resistance transporter
LTGVAGDQVYLYGKRRTVLVFFATMMGMSLAPFTLGVITPGLGQLAQDLGDAQLLPWVMTSYLLTTATTVPLWGRLADVHGRRRSYLTALALFAGGALVCGLAPSMPVAIAGRVITGVGAGGMVPISMAITADLIAPRERGKWLGISGVLFGGFTAVAPVTGGWITDVAGWRWCFFSVAIAGAVALVVAVLYVRIERVQRDREIDFLGAGLIIAGVGSFLVAISFGGEQYAWDSPVVLGLFAAAAVFLAGFAWWYPRAPDPIVPLRLLRGRTFAMTQLGTMGAHGTLLSTVTFAPLLVQGVFGVSAADAGAMLVAYSIALLLVGFLSGQVVSRTGVYRPLLIASPLVCAVGATMLTQITPESPLAVAVVALLVIGVGLGLITGTIIVVAQNAVRSDEQAAASAMTAFTRILNGAVVVAIVGVVMTARVGAELQERLPGVDAAQLSLAAAAGGSEALSAAEQEQARAAFAAGAPGAFAVLLPLLALSAVAMLMTERIELRRTLKETAEPADAASGTI